MSSSVSNNGVCERAPLESNNQRLCALKVFETDLCSICRDGIQAKATVLVCGHSFHEECITQWLDIVRQCPYCRTPVESTKDPVKEALNEYAAGRHPSTDYTSWWVEQSNIRRWLRTQFRNMELEPSIVSEMLEDPNFFSKEDILFGVEYGMFSDEDIAYILEQEYITEQDLLEVTRVL